MKLFHSMVISGLVVASLGIAGCLSKDEANPTAPPAAKGPATGSPSGLLITPDGTGTAPDNSIVPTAINAREMITATLVNSLYTAGAGRLNPPAQGSIDDPCEPLVVDVTGSTPALKAYLKEHPLGGENGGKVLEKIIFEAERKFPASCRSKDSLNILREDFAQFLVENPPQYLAKINEKAWPITMESPIENMSIAKLTKGSFAFVGGNFKSNGAPSRNVILVIAPADANKVTLVVLKNVLSKPSAKPAVAGLITEEMVKAANIVADSKAGAGLIVGHLLVRRVDREGTVGYDSVNLAGIGSLEQVSQKGAAAAFEIMAQ